MMYSLREAILMAVESGGGGGGGSSSGGTGGGGGSTPPPPSSGGSGSSQADAFADDDNDASGETLEERFGSGPDTDNQYWWQDAVVGKMIDDIKAVASQYDMDLDFLLGWFDGQQLNLINYLQNNVIDMSTAPGMSGGVAPGFYGTPAGVNSLFGHARNWLGARFPGLLDAFSGVGASGSGRGRSGGGRGGAGGPTPDQIRAQFDLDELSDAANTMWRGLVLEDAPAARAMAKAYVEAIVANPEQKLDFEQFVLKQIRDTSRYKVIYKNKPASMSEQQFLQPIFQQVSQTLGAGFGEQVADITINQARLGTSPAQLQQRLQREDQVQTSAPFLQNLGQRMSGFRGVLK